MKLEPIELEVAQTKLGYSLAFNNQILTTHNGFAPVHHSAPHLIRHIISEYDAYPEITIEELRIVEPVIAGSSYHMFTIQKEWIEQGKEELITEFPLSLLKDPILHGAIGSERRDQIPRYLQISRWLGEPEFKELQKRADAVPYFLGDEERIEPEDTAEALASPEVAKLRDLYISLTPEQRTVVMFLHAIHHGPVLFPLALALGKCTPTEYAQGISAGHMMLSQTWGDVTPEDHHGAFEQVKNDASKAMDYLLIYQEGTPEQRIRKVIASKENSEVEYKPVLRGSWIRNRNMTHENMKTIAGFLNAKGGQLLIGVSDDGDFLGIEQDGFRNDDGFGRYLIDSLKNALGTAATALVTPEILPFGNGSVCLVTCPKSDFPVYCKFRRDRLFFVRSGPTTSSLGPEETAHYLIQRFPDFANKQKEAV